MFRRCGNSCFPVADDAFDATEMLVWGGESITKHTHTYTCIHKQKQTYIFSSIKSKAASKIDSYKSRANGGCVYAYFLYKNKKIKNSKKKKRHIQLFLGVAARNWLTNCPFYCGMPNGNVQQHIRARRKVFMYICARTHVFTVILRFWGFVIANGIKKDIQKHKFIICIHNYLYVCMCVNCVFKHSKLINAHINAGR